MKLPDFNHAEQRWDAWQAFHVDLGRDVHLTQFDTGEFIVGRHAWRPHERQIFKDLHIQIVATNDDDCPRLYVPGSNKPIPWAHLNHKGMQILLLDYDHKRAVALFPWITEGIPERFTRACSIAVYYAGPKAIPIGAPITRHFPRPLTSEQRAHVKELETACKVWLDMRTNSGSPKPSGKAVLPLSDFIETPFNALTDVQRAMIAMNGFNPIIKEVHPWLTFDVEKGVTDYDDNATN